MLILIFFSIRPIVRRNQVAVAGEASFSEAF